MPRLFELDGLEVSLVPAGAVKKKFFLRKEEGDNMEELQKMLESVLKTELVGEEKIDAIMKDAKLSENNASAVKAAFKLLNQVKSSMSEDQSKATFEKLLAQLGYAQEKQVAKAPTKKEDGTIDFSEVPEEIREQLQTLWKEKEDESTKALEGVTKERDDLKKEADEAKEAAELKKYVDQAASFKNLAVKSEEMGPVLKKLADTDKDGYEKMIETLKSADEASGKLFDENGSSGEGDAAVGYEKIEKAAEALRKEDGKSELTKEQAVAEVINRQPELYNEYLNNK